MKHLEGFDAGSIVRDEEKINSLKTLVQEKRAELEEKVEAFNKPDKYVNKTNDNSEAELVALEEEIRELERNIKSLESGSAITTPEKKTRERTAKEKPAIKTEVETESKKDGEDIETPAEAEANAQEGQEAPEEQESIREPEKESLKDYIEKVTKKNEEEKARVAERKAVDQEQAEILTERLKNQTESEANYSEILKEDTEKIAAATTIDDLCVILSNLKMKGLLGSQDYFPSELLVKIIKDIDYRDPSDPTTFDQLTRVTRTAGLRFKVSELLSNKLQQKIEAAPPEKLVEMANEEDKKGWEIIPAPETTSKEIVPVSPEIIDKPNQEVEKPIKFEDLTPGQQAYVKDKIENIRLSRTKELADRKFDVDLKNSGFFKKIILGTFKRFNVAKTEKEYATELDPVTEIEIQEIYKIANNLKIETQLGGRYRIDFLNGEAEDSPEINRQDKWNSELTAWTRIPKEWEFDSASPSEKKQFAEAKEQYEKTRSEILNHLAGKVGREKALQQFALTESQMDLNKFMSENPDAASVMNDMKRQSTFGRALKDIAADLGTERGLYLALGFGTRFAVGAFGIIAAPLVAGPVGAMSARFRAKEALKIDSKKTRRNYSEHVVDKNSEGADVLSSKLELLITNFRSNEGNPEKQKAILDKLRTRLSYTQDKLENDLVNYGDTSSRLGNQFKLMQLISSAQYMGIQLDQNEYNNKWKGKKTEERLDRLMAGLSDKFDAKKKKYIRDKIIRGAIFAAGAATLGALIAHWSQEGFGNSDSVSDPTPEPVPSNPEDATKAVEEAITSKDPVVFTEQISDGGNYGYDSTWRAFKRIVSQNKKAFGLPEDITDAQLNTFVHKNSLNSIILDPKGPGGGIKVQGGDSLFVKINPDGSLMYGVKRLGKILTGKK